MDAPDDILGTVRAGDGTLAIRAHSIANIDYTDDLVWFIVDIGGELNLADTDLEDINQLIGTWPIVYQPQTTP
jgi:hypothetical protein